MNSFYFSCAGDKIVDLSDISFLSLFYPSVFKKRFCYKYMLFIVSSIGIDMIYFDITITCSL